MQIGLDELIKIVESTPDNSVALREELENIVPVEKETIVVERDPAFYKYKE